MVKEIKDSDFKKQVLENSKTVLVDFYAPWCNPCKTLLPILTDLASKNTDIEVVKLNIDEQMNNAIKYGVRNVPSVLVFKNGELVDKQVGIAPLEAYERFVK